MPSTEINQLLAAAAEACDERKAEDIRILALDPSESGLCDYFLICNGNSDRQNLAITDAIEMKLKQEFGVYPTSVEGRRVGEWILMDYVDFIVHVFSAEKRAFYGLERLRKTATSLSIADLNAEIKNQIEASRKKAPAKKAAAKKTAVKTTAVKKAPTKKAAKTAVKPLAKSTSKSSATKAAKKTAPAKKTSLKKATKAVPKKK